MSALGGRLLRIGLTVAGVWIALTLALPVVMARYGGFSIGLGPSFPCLPGTPCVRSIASVYGKPLEAVLLDATLRSLALVAGAGVLALTVGVLLGALIASLRHRTLRAGVLHGAVGAVAAVPSFFVALTAQMAVIFAGASLGRTVLPVYGYGLDEHLVLPLLALSLPAVTNAAQASATRFAEVLDADFVTTARAKGLLSSWILRVHVLPHVLPLALESVAGGLRVSVASLPVVEYLFVWNGVAYLALQAIALKDAAALTASALVLGTLFASLSALLDLPRPRTA